MQGPANTMRGRKHSQDTSHRVSEAKKKQYSEGSVRVTKYKLSKGEREVATKLRELGYEIKQQFHIHGVPYLYDFYIPSLGLILEYQGDYWHANPAKYLKGTYLKFQGGVKKLVDDIWDRDLKRQEAATQAGFTVKFIWESEYKRRGFQAVGDLLR
jgi:G:T-mismatch repair DNA endonuclease (very short patch repair protein)